MKRKCEPCVKGQVGVFPEIKGVGGMAFQAGEITAQGHGSMKEHGLQGSGDVYC